MSTQALQHTAGKLTAAPASRPRFRISLAWTSRIGHTLDRWLLGGAGPRGYRREGFPEVEMHQVMSGRRDRFDSLR